MDELTPYDGGVHKGIYGAEYPVGVVTNGPYGESTGMGDIELFMHRKYARYQPRDPRSFERSPGPRPGGS